MVQARRLMLSLLVLFLAASINQISAADEVPRLRISLSPIMGSAPLAFAQGWGLFEKHGLAVELVGLSDDEERSAALMTGDIDGMVCGVTTAILLFASGTDIVITSAAYQREQTNSLAILSPSTFNIDSLETLFANRTPTKIATIYRSDFEYHADRLLESTGFKIGEEPPYVYWTDMLQLALWFAAQSVPAAVLPEPYITYIANFPLPGGAGLPEFVHLSDFEGIEQLPSVVVFRRPVVEGRGELINGFYKAYREAIDIVNCSNREELIEMGIDKALALFFPGVTEDSIPDGILDSFVIPRFSQPETLSSQQFNDVVAWLVTKRYTGGNPSYEDMTTDRFLQ